MQLPKTDIRKYFTPENIIEQLPFIFFLALLAMIYIYNTNLAIRNLRETNRLSKETKEMQWEYQSAKSDFENQSMQTKVAAKAGNSLGIKELTHPPFRITVSH